MNLFSSEQIFFSSLKIVFSKIERGFSQSLLRIMEVVLLQFDSDVLERKTARIKAVSVAEVESAIKHLVNCEYELAFYTVSDETLRTEIEKQPWFPGVGFEKVKTS